MTDEPTITRGSGDVLADIGFAPVHRFKAQLVTRLRRAMDERDLNQTETARMVGLSQADLSRLLSGKFRNVSVERLMNILTKLDLDVEVTVRRRGEATGETIHYEHA